MTINVTPYEKNDLIRYMTELQEIKLKQIDKLFYKDKLKKKEREMYYKTREEVKDINQLLAILNGVYRDDTSLFRRTKDTIRFEL